MSRPTGKSCARCAKLLIQCDHLENCYDFATGVKCMSDQDLVEYALNRMLALDRDNGNKKQGILPSRRYRSKLDAHDLAVQKAKDRLHNPK